MGQSTYIRDGFVSAGNAQVTGSLGVTGGITGSLLGTATSATLAADSDRLGGVAAASYALNSAFTSFASTGSNTFVGNQTITGSITITQNLTVLGSSSIQYITSSQLNIANNLISVNTNSPGVRFGGLAVIDSGSSPQRSGSLLFDSQQDQWVFVHQNNAGAVTSSVLIMGPQTYNSLGSETNLTVNRLPKSTNAEHIGDSNISDTGAVVSINSNTQITGSIRISSVTSSISTLTLINSSSVANPAGAPLLMFSSSATNTYLINSQGAFYATINTSGFTDRSELGVGGLRLHNAANTPTITSATAMNISTGTHINFLAGTTHRFYTSVYIGGGTAPTARLHILGGTATASTAPLKLTAGTNLTTPEAGAVEFDGTNLFFTPSTVRHTILTNTNPASITGNVSVTGNLSSTAKYILGSDLSLTPIAGNQSVLTSWWGLQIVGNKQSTVDYTPSAIGNNSDFSVIIPNQQAAKIGLIVRGQTSQTGNLLEFRNVSNTGLSAFDASGQLSLGKATPTAVLDVNGNTRITGSLNVTNGITGSLFGSASYATQALSASYAPGGATFPYNGNAQITGSLLVYGNSLVAGYNPTPLEGTIQDGVTSVLGDLNDWDSNYYQGDVLYSETAAGTITFGQLCYRTQNETWELADATAIASAATNMLGICVKSSTISQPTSILINGFVETSTYAAILKTGEPLYMATTAGSMTKTAPTTAGNIVRLIGHTFWDSNTNSKIIIRFNPENSWIEL